MRHRSVYAATVILFLVAPQAVNAATWCLVTRDGSMLCRFRTFDQCMQSRSGRGDSCAQDLSTEVTPSKAPPKSSPSAISKPQPVPAKPTEQPAKQAAPAQPQRPTVPQAGADQNPAQKFAAARDLVLAGRYEAGIAALRALGFDEHPDVAAYVGLALNKLGHTADASAWYEKALAGNPKHLLTLSYYGMLRAEQGDLVKAQQNLDMIKALCGGTACKEYIALDALIASRKR
jgi:hypothetical protein